ncbi:MAG: NUDIX domain-containing protein [Candidatus Dojkabacteria bacterium]|nr:NUDIX domain-containing protein [Candidatus Dojkabacteria bacterium]MDQ7020990.1 NUDIX domain-containing protein [Candidatus Dojkabacteria bacterium]
MDKPDKQENNESTHEYTTNQEIRAMHIENGMTFEIVEYRSGKKQELVVDPIEDCWLAAKAMIINESNKLLMIIEKGADGQLFFAFPGGRMESTEPNLATTLRRKIKSENGEIYRLDETNVELGILRGEFANSKLGKKVG